MSEPKNFMDRALGGYVLELDLIDDEIEAWHSSSSSEQLNEWLGMTAEEYALFVERPQALPMILLGRKRGQNPRELLAVMDDNAVALAARGASAKGDRKRR